MNSLKIQVFAFIAAVFTSAIFGYRIARYTDSWNRPLNPRSVFITRDPLTVKSSVGLGDHTIPAGSEFFIEVLVKDEAAATAHLTGTCGFVTPDGREIWCTAGDEITFPSYAPKGGMVPTQEVLAAFQKAADEPPLEGPTNKELLETAIAKDSTVNTGEAVYAEMRVYGRTGTPEGAAIGPYYSTWADAGDKTKVSLDWRLEVIKGDYLRAAREAGWTDESELRWEPEPGVITLGASDGMAERYPRIIIDGVKLERSEKRPGEYVYEGTDERAMFMNYSVDPEKPDWRLAVKDHTNPETGEKETYHAGYGWIPDPPIPADAPPAPIPD